MSYVEAFANHLSNELDKMEARALKAEAECAELGESMRRVGIEQFEANAARLRAEEALRAAFEAINDDDISGAYLILRTYLTTP